MPIYEFECLTCGQRFERLQKISDPDPEHCECERREPVRRALTAAAFRLKGGGWYETDFKGDGDKKRNLVESGDAKPKEAAGEGTKPTESKTETKSDASTKSDSAPAA
jgi:putative FmdB family regulatory protein